MSDKPVIAHVLRKYDPREWAGGETSIKDLISELHNDFSFKMFCPKLEKPLSGPFEKLGVDIERFNTFLPSIGLSSEQKKQLTQIGGNLMSFELIKQLLFASNISLIHLHTLGLIGGIARTVAKKRKIPLVVSLHGSMIDIPQEMLTSLKEKTRGSVSYARALFPLLKPSRIIGDADAVIAFNEKEKSLLQERYPNQRILHFRHGIGVNDYKKDYRDEALAAFPQISSNTMCLIVARIDPVKNQLWVIKQLPKVLKKYPNFQLGMVGACTDDEYRLKIRNEVKALGLTNHVHFFGAFPPLDPRLIGLYQLASFTLLPSIAEPFGLVILESWAAGTPVVSSDVSGPKGIINHRETGWLFNLDQPESFFQAVDEVMQNNDLRNKIKNKSREVLDDEYDIENNSLEIKKLYYSLLRN